MTAPQTNRAARISGSITGVAPEPGAIRGRLDENRAAVETVGATDGATGQPVRAEPAPASYTRECSPSTDPLDSVRASEGLELAETVDTPPDMEGIGSIEDRAHTAAWHRFLATSDDS